MSHMADTTSRPAWLTLLIVGAVFAALILGAYAWSEQNQDQQQDDFINGLCATDPNC